eukprot:scaffold20310_cov125-Isochrysis_galbana.AAC.8
MEEPPMEPQMAMTRRDVQRRRLHDAPTQSTPAPALTSPMGSPPLWLPPHGHVGAAAAILPEATSAPGPPSRLLFSLAEAAAAQIGGDTAAAEAEMKGTLRNPTRNDGTRCPFPQPLHPDPVVDAATTRLARRGQMTAIRRTHRL